MVLSTCDPGVGINNGTDGDDDPIEIMPTDTQIFDPDSEHYTFLMVRDAHGYTWTLSIPPQALMQTVTIKMSVQPEIVNMTESVATLRSGVKLEPDGIQFMKSVRLTATPPDSIPDPGLSFIFSVREDNSGFDFAPTTNSQNIAAASIWHFSSYGYDNSTQSDWDKYMDLLKKWVEEDYKNAINAAKLFVKNNLTPTPPVPPSVSWYCRCTEVNPENGEWYEFMHYFFEPYVDLANILMRATKAMELVYGIDFDNTDALGWVNAIFRMAEKSILNLGDLYVANEPPDEMFPIYFAAMAVERNIAESSIPPVYDDSIVNYKIIKWLERVRDYYLGQLTLHEYRAFPGILRLEKWVETLGGENRTADIQAAMTFQVNLKTDFSGTWYSSDTVIQTGTVQQEGAVKNITMDLVTMPDGFLAGTANNMNITSTSGTFTTKSNTIDFAKAPQTLTGSVFLLNWDPCVTNSIDVQIGGFIENNESGALARTASTISLDTYYWVGAAAFMFTIPMTNNNPTIGSQAFSGSGSRPKLFTGSAKMDITVLHTPQ